MDSGIARTSSISSRNRDRAASRREVHEELNLAHMGGVMKSVRHKAREQGSGKSRVVLEEHTPSSSASNSSKPVLWVKTEFHYKLGPSITEKKQSRVSTPVKGDDADRRQNAEERRHSQRSRIPQSKDINLSKAVGEQTKEKPALRRQKPTLQLRADFATLMDPQAFKNKNLRLSPAREGDSDRRHPAQSRCHSQKIEKSQPKDTSCSPAAKELSKESPVPGHQKPTLQVRKDSASAECLAHPDNRQIHPYASQNEQLRVSNPIVMEDTDQCQILEIISLYEEVREEKKEEILPPAMPPKSARRGKEQSQRVACAHSGIGGAVMPATEKQAKTTSAPKRNKPTLRIRTDLDSANHGNVGEDDFNLADYLRRNPLALENEHQGASSPADKESADRCKDYKEDSSGETTQRIRLVDIVRQGLPESEAGSPNLNPSRSACLYGDYSCIYEEYSD